MRPALMPCYPENWELGNTSFLEKKNLERWFPWVAEAATALRYFLVRIRNYSASRNGKICATQFESQSPDRDRVRSHFANTNLDS